MCACVVYQPRITDHGDHTFPLWPHIGPRLCQRYNCTGIKQTVSVWMANCRDQEGKRNQTHECWPAESSLLSQLRLYRRATQCASHLKLSHNQFQPCSSSYNLVYSMHNMLMSLGGICKLQRAEENLKGVAVPLRPTPLVLQSLVSRWAGWEVRTTRCCMSLQVRFLLEHAQAHTETHTQPHKERNTHTERHTW